LKKKRIFEKKDFGRKRAQLVIGQVKEDQVGELGDLRSNPGEGIVRQVEVGEPAHLHDGRAERFDAACRDAKLRTFLPN
jgi:hypothetical protein